MVKNITCIALLLFYALQLTGQSGNVHNLIISAQQKDSLKDFNGSLDDLNNALAISLNDTAYWLRARVHLELNNIKEALKDVNAVINLKHKHPEAYYTRGLIKAKNENYTGAVSDFNKAIELKNDFTKAYYNRALAFAFLQEFNLAIKDFTKAIELKEDYVSAWFNRGCWKDVSGDREGAIKDLEKAHELDVKNADICVEFAIVYYEIGQKEKACNQLGVAKSLGCERSEELMGTFCK